MAYASRESPQMICSHRGALSGADRGSADSPAAFSRSFVTRPDWEAFRGTLTMLRDRCPAAMSVVVRTSWLPESVLGQCVRRRKRFVIMLSRKLTESQAVEVLCHEWAHALAWNYALDRLAKKPGLTDEEFQAASHDEAWGCAYSRVWREYVRLD